MEKLDEKQFIIPFVGLKQGKHEFSYNLTDAFFESYEYSIIQQGEVHVNFILDKKDTMMVGEFELAGHVKTACDRCNEPLEIQLEGEFKLVYKFASEDEEDEALVVIFPEEYEINIKDSLLEFTTVLLPFRSVHDEGECNEEMLSYLSEYIINPFDEEEDDDYNDDEYDDFDDSDDDEIEDIEDDQPNDGPIDPRWEALKNLKK